MGRSPCCDKAKVKRGPWSPEEDATLMRYLEAHGTGGNWIALPHKAGLKRCGKSCRLRWLNYLRPDIKHGGFTEEEDNIILNLYSQMGSRWSLIASQLPGRTDNDVKNYWNTKLKKKILAGNPGLSMKINNPNDASTNTKSSITPCSLTPVPCVPKSNSAFPGSLALPELTDIGTTQNFNLDPVQFHFGTSSTTSHIVLPSHREGSSISDSSSLAVDNSCTFSVPLDVVVEDSGLPLNPEFGFPYGIFFQGKASEVPGSSVGCYSSSLLSDLGHADVDVKPQGANQSVVNQY